jgi:hypothetical protein
VPVVPEEYSRELTLCRGTSKWISGAGLQLQATLYSTLCKSLANEGTPEELPSQFPAHECITRISYTAEEEPNISRHVGGYSLQQTRRAH